MESEALDTKLTQLEITVQRTEFVLTSARREQIKRHLEALKAISQLKKIANKEELSEINKWHDEIDEKLNKADIEISRLEGWLNDKEKHEKFSAQEEQLKFELKLHETKLKLQTELTTNATPDTSNTTIITVSEKIAKLPKLVISKFNGSYMDWPRFWGKFSEAVDKSTIAPISKFTYLCELLETSVKRVVEALPFTPEGYNRAKSILKDRFGKESEIEKAYVKEILELPHITSPSPKKIGEFYEKLSYSVQALETMKRLDQVSGNVSMTLDKLPAIRGDLARGGDFKVKGCVYCGDENHKAIECNKVTDITERKRILAQTGLCFSCATRNHRAAECPSKTSCQYCKRRHHTSLCEQAEDGNVNNGKLMTDGKSGDAIFPVVVVKVDGITCRALVDSGADSSYTSAKLIDLLKKKPSATKIQLIDMLMSSRVTRIESYDVVIGSVDDSYEMEVRVTKVNKGELLRIDNPRYEQLIRKHQHLNQVEIADHDSKQQLPIHMILGSGEYARIKTGTVPLVGEDGDPVAELTKLGWLVMSPGADFDKTTVLMTQTSQSDYENLCRLNVLGIADSGEIDQEMVYQDFKKEQAEAAQKQQLKTDDKKPTKESTPDKSQDNSQPENLPKQPNSDKEPQPASNAPPAQDTQPNYQANNQAPGLTSTAQQANNDTKEKQKPIEESAPLKPNLKDGKQQVEDQPKPAANSKPASVVKSKEKSSVGVPAYSYKGLVKQELEAIKDSPSTKQFKADVLKEVQVKLKSGTFPQIDTSKVFVKHKVAKPNRKHRVTKLKHKKPEVKHAIAHKKGQGKHATVYKKDEAKHATVHKKDEAKHGIVHKKGEAKHGIAHKHRKLH
ncbi:Pol poly, partial [Paramuricea clavata]